MRSHTAATIRCISSLSVIGLLVACSTPILAVDEAIRFENGETRFIAFAQKKTGWTLDGVEGVEVQFAVDGETVATAVTDERGFAKAIVPTDKPTDRFEATADFEGGSFRTDAELVSWESHRVIVACDIDSTISDTNLGALFFDDLDLTSTPIADSAAVLTEIAKHFHLIYVTARPRFTLDKTRRWLEDHGYPRQPVVTSLTVRDALGQTTYKTRTLKSLRKHYGNLLIGIGNTGIDADSYRSHGMLAMLYKSKEEFAFRDDVLVFTTWDEARRFFQRNREVLIDPERLQAALRQEEDLFLPGEP